MMPSSKSWTSMRKDMPWQTPFRPLWVDSCIYADALLLATNSSHARSMPMVEQPCVVSYALLENRSVRILDPGAHVGIPCAPSPFLLLLRSRFVVTFDFERGFQPPAHAKRTEFASNVLPLAWNMWVCIKARSQLAQRNLKRIVQQCMILTPYVYTSKSFNEAWLMSNTAVVLEGWLFEITCTTFFHPHALYV